MIKTLRNYAILAAVLFGLVSPIYVNAQALNTSLLGQLSYSNDLSDVWGYAAGGREYAIVGVTNGTSIVDVTNPAAPVEVDFVSGPNSIWRDIKTYGNYAYVTNETGSGLHIINLSNLPGSVTASFWTGGPLPGGGTASFSSAHNIYIDEFGFAYITGANYLSGGAIICDLNGNPTSPQIVGVYNNNYCHDAYVQNNIMYTSEINVGIFAIVDVSNKANPVILGSSSTPNNFTHNAWASADGNYLYTTDETNGAGVAAYDISDPTDIEFLDIQYSNQSGAIPHNTHVLGDFLITSHYKDGITIIDASIPSDLVEVGYYDTSPTSGGGFAGCWGAYPYLPSGVILASDSETGLYIIDPTYVNAIRLQGTITDASTGNIIFGASAEIVATGSSSTTNLFGQYSLGVTAAGTYDVTYSAPGYNSQTITGVSITSGTNIQDAALVPFPGAADCTGYCSSDGGTVDEWIESVTFAGVTNNSGDNGGYINFTGSVPISLSQGSSYPFSLTPGYSGTLYDEAWTIWIDYNGNGNFDDPGEQIYTSASATDATQTGSFTVPASTTLGYTAMRIQMKWNTADGPCGSYTYGEVEDYCVELNDGSPTCDTPTGLSADISNWPTNFTVSWNAVSGATSYIISGKRAGSPAAFQSVTSATNSRTINGNRLNFNRTYEWKVQAVCGGLTSAESASDFFSTPPSRLGEMGSFEIYPNPTADQLTIRYDAAADGELVLRITDLLGSQLITEQFAVSQGQQQFEISTASLVPGTYLVQLMQGDASEVSTLQVAR